MRESVQSWAPQDPWPLIENNGIMEFDSNTFLNADQVLQLQDLFGQDDFDREASLLYDEFTFAPETDNSMVETTEPSDLMNMDNIINTVVTEVPLAKRRRSSSCSTSSSISSHFSSSSSSEDEEDNEELESTSHRRFSMSSSSDSEPEQEVVTPYLHRRQMEEMILDKITNQLEPEKLPGILAIISTTHEDEVEEVEIDLAKLDRDQLERILSYVNACLIEKEGGAKVKLSDYIVERKPVVTAVAQPPSVPKVEHVQKKKNKRKNNRRKSSVAEGHTVNGSSTATLSSAHGPISMSALTELESNSKTSKNNKRKRRAKKSKRDDDVSVHMSNNVDLFKDSIASTKPKRKSAIHKRRLLEEMLQPSNEDSSDEEEDSGSGIIVFGDEQMDMAVTQNETIVHQEQSSIVQEKPILPTIVEKIDDEEDDELIDIMM